MYRSLRLMAPLAALTLLGCQAQPSQTADGSFSAAEFKSHHAEIHTHLGHIDAMAQDLPEQTPAKQRETMRFITDFLAEHILTHAREEERTLYPRADTIAGPRFTESMRYEHRVVESWIQELRGIAQSPDPDARAFARRTQRLLGLLEAHFGAEEEVVVPVIANR